MLTAIYTGDKKLGGKTGASMGNEKQIAAMIQSLPEDTTVNIVPVVSFMDRKTEWDHTEHYRIATPDGGSYRFACSDWSIVHKDTKRKETKNAVVPVVSVREEELKQTTLPPQNTAPAAVVPDYIKDHIEVIVVSDKPKETITVPVVPKSLSIPIPTRRETAHDEVKGVKGITVYDSPYCVWIGGNTYPVREQIKAHGFKWSPNKHQWYKDVSEEVEV